jgi:hypothetical protein
LFIENLSNLKGAQLLSKKEQQSISGGSHPIDCEESGGIWTCVGSTCGCVYSPIDPPQEK